MKICFKFLIFIFLITLSSIDANAISTYPEIYLKPNSEVIAPGENLSLYLRASEVKNLFSLSLDFKFNTELVEVLSIEPGNFFDSEPIEYNSRFTNSSENSKTISFYSTFTGNHEGKTSSEDPELVKINLKILKECKIPLDIISTNNNLFIGTPNFRVIIIDKDLNKFNISPSSSYIKTNNFKSDEEIKLFISDVYRKTFSREPDEFGFNYWYNKLISQEYSVRNFLINILNEKEFIEKNLPNEEFITAMYSIIANREPDQMGYNYWLTKLMEYQKQMDIKSSKSNIILLICNESELSNRASKLNLKF